MQRTAKERLSLLSFASDPPPLIFTLCGIGRRAGIPRAMAAIGQFLPFTTRDLLLESRRWLCRRVATGRQRQSRDADQRTEHNRAL